MLVYTYYKRPLKKGDLVDVDDAVAERWAQHGIARLIQGAAPEPTPPPKKPKGGKKDDAG